MNTLLKDLQYLFRYQNKSLTEFGFSEPQEYLTEIQREKMKYDPIMQG